MNRPPIPGFGGGLSQLLYQQDVQSMAIMISIHATEFTVNTLFSLMQKTASSLSNRKYRQKPLKVGQQKLKDLTKKSDALDKISISKEDLATIKRHLKKNNVDFSLATEKTPEGQLYTCYFKAKDTVVIRDAIDKCIKDMSEPKKMSLKERLKQAKEKAKQRNLQKQKTQQKTKNIQKDKAIGR